MQGARVWSLVRELRFHMQCGVAKKKKKMTTVGVSDILWPHRLYSLWNSSNKNIGVGRNSHRNFLMGSYQPMDWTQVSHITRGFFTSWATREAQEYWSGKLIPSLEDIPDPGIEPGSPALQVDSLPAELSGKTLTTAGASNENWSLGDGVGVDT